MDNAGFIVAAFGVVWVGLFIYIFMLVQREKGLRRDIATLKEGMKKA